MNKTRNDEYLKAFGGNLRKLRKKHGLTMMELAFEADIEYSQVAKIEKGTINTTVSTAYNLAIALKITPHELFLFTHPPKGKN